MDASEDLRAPALLIAMPHLDDPFFHRSLVLLVHHDEQGSVGFIVNRPTEIPVEEILQGMELAWEGQRQALAYFGGPVQPQLGTVLFEGRQEAEAEHSTAIAEGVRLTQHMGDLSELAAAPPERMRLCLGYAGWGEGQLLEEILRNDWLTAPVAGDLVFATDPAAAWEEALSRLGVDPASLASWRNVDGGGDAN